MYGRLGDLWLGYGGGRVVGDDEGHLVYTVSWIGMLQLNKDDIIFMYFASQSCAS